LFSYCKQIMVHNQEQVRSLNRECIGDSMALY
jgi:hypothetical protein